ncbi:MAG: hypothetical protein ACLFR1_06910 [Spirochaetia bacterium]
MNNKNKIRLVSPESNDALFAGIAAEEMTTEEAAEIEGGLPWWNIASGVLSGLASSDSTVNNQINMGASTQDVVISGLASFGIGAIAGFVTGRPVGFVKFFFASGNQKLY